VYTYDCTPRDGVQGVGFHFGSAKDKLEYCQLTREMLGIDIIEGGFVHPTQQPVLDFFELASRHDNVFGHLASFGMTMAPLGDVKTDKQVNALVDLKVPYITVVGKASSFNALNDLGLDGKGGLRENLRMVSETIAHIREHRPDATIIFDGEHSFRGLLYVPDQEKLQQIDEIRPGLIFDPAYTLEVLQTAKDAGADWIVPCDTTGWVPSNLAFREAMEKIRGQLPEDDLGLHIHHDSARAEASTIDGVVEYGVRQVQGTFLRTGERAGNASIQSIIGTLQVQNPNAGYTNFVCIPEENVVNLKLHTDRCAKRFRVVSDPREPYVGDYVFAHKAGMHQSGQERAGEIAHLVQPYQNFDAGLVGNETRMIKSDQAGKSAYRLWANGDEEKAREIAAEAKQLQSRGFVLEEAEHSFYLQLLRRWYQDIDFVDILKYRVIEEHGSEVEDSIEGTVVCKVRGMEDYAPLHVPAEGDGAVNAIDNALRKALTPYFPELNDLQLIDWDPRDIEAKLGDDIHLGTAKRVWVPIVSRFDGVNFRTGSIAESSLKASVEAIVDSYTMAVLHAKGKFDGQGVYVDK
ncbi:MAG: alpha-isopropylmalate synthase regulatory domain-containing protein, partial [Candidatus Woesearchaeota archaeon]|nr:alpha-isopropylmalate synthase regulatory domain-containing protein [Candidatus Woesearchaeota archaeon]